MSRTNPTHFQKKFSEWTSTKTIRFTAFFIFLILLIWLIGSYFATEYMPISKNAPTIDQSINELITTIIGYAAPIVVMLLLLLVLGAFRSSGLRIKGLWKGMWRLGFEIVIVLVVFIVTIVVFKKCYDFHVYDGKGNDLTKIILLNVATLFCTGLFEEILYRGFILNGLLSHWGNSRKAVIKAVFVSAFLFGVLHMMNLVGEAENYKGSNYALDCVLPTAFQSLMAFSFGVYFGFVYLRVNNLFACIIMHALFDFLISIMGLFEKEGVNVDPLFSTLFPSMLLIFEAIGELSISYFIFKRTQCDKINLIFNIKK